MWSPFENLLGTGFKMYSARNLFFFNMDGSDDGFKIHALLRQTHKEGAFRQAKDAKIVHYGKLMYDILNQNVLIWLSNNKNKQKEIIKFSKLFILLKLFDQHKGPILLYFWDSSWGPLLFKFFPSLVREWILDDVAKFQIMWNLWSRPKFSGISASRHLIMSGRCQDF